MNALQLTTNEPLTMTSREIAELTGKEHRNVRRDIETMAAELSLSFEQKSEASTGGRPSALYLLPKRETLILVSGYSIAMRARIIDRWQELEEQTKGPALPDFSNPVVAARAWAEQLEKRQEAEALVTLQHKALALAQPNGEAVQVANFPTNGMQIT